MRPITSTISLDEARRIVSDTVQPLERTETVALEAAPGRVVAEPVIAPHDVPPFARAAMDGYAVVAADLAGATRETPRELRILERVYTGALPSSTIAPGTCAEIATGAPMPAGADAVVMVEETDHGDGRTVRIFASARTGQNIGAQGADIQAGQVVLARGEWLNASRVGAVAAVGLGAVEVFLKPRVALLSTGNEIVPPGTALQPGQIHDINRYTLSAIVSANGGVPVPRRAAHDTLEDLERAVDDCLDCDVLVFSGGSSVGDRDYILDVLGRRGEVLFHGISVKPGKPTAFGRIEGKPFFGMPGYPTSCLSNGYMLLAPALRQMARLPEDRARTVEVPLAAAVRSAHGRHQFYTVRLEHGQAVPAFKASGDITSMSRADGYFEIDADTDVVPAGTVVTVTLF
ncbi:MAG: gephyrin-like molybdotransferase Glp [Vicinamibacterales bacterium]